MDLSLGESGTDAHVTISRPPKDSVRVYDGGVDGLRIGSGRLAGKGVYAARDFAAGEIVVAFELTPLTLDQFRALAPGEEMFVHSYGGRRWLYPEPARWVNHADQPSCYQDFERSCDVALRRIEAGEAITIDATDETRRELSTFLDAYVDAQQRDQEALAALIATDCVLWTHGQSIRGREQVARRLSAEPAQALVDSDWQLGTGRWEALCSAQIVGEEGARHATVFLRVLEGNWQVAYEHRE